MWTFKPHSKQQLVENSAAHYIWCFGGNRSGKTEISVRETMREWDGTHPFRWLRPRPDGQSCLVWILSETSDVQRDTLQAKISRFMPESWLKRGPNGKPVRYERAGVWNFMELEVPNARYGKLAIKVVFKTYDQSIDTFESASVDQVVADEEPPEDKYNAIEARLLDAKAWGNGWFKSALTPTEGKGWSVEKYWTAYVLGELDPDIFTVKMSTYDNAHNLGGAENVKKLENVYPEHERAARIYGDPRAKFGYVMDKYIDNYYPAGHLIRPFLPDWSVMTPYESYDYAYAAPTSVGFYAAHMNGDIYRYAEIYVRNHSIPQVKALVYHMRKRFGYHSPYIAVIDRTAGNRDSTGYSKIAQYASKERNVWIGRGLEPTEAYLHNLRKQVMNGQLTQAQFDHNMKVFMAKEGFIQYPIPMMEANNKRMEGWEITNEVLEFSTERKRPRAFIVDTCKEFRREARTAKWKPAAVLGTQTGKGIDGDDHALDEFRYLVSLRPVFVKHYNGIVRKELLKQEAKRVRKY